MRIREFLKAELVVADLQADGKDVALQRLAELFVHHASVGQLSSDDVAAALLTRERLGSTGVGEGVAIPHAKIAGLGELVACFARLPAGVPFDSIYQQPVYLIFGLLVPENSAGMHLKALARISRLLKRPEFRQSLLAARSGEEIFSAFMNEDEKF